MFFRTLVVLLAFANFVLAQAGQPAEQSMHHPEMMHGMEHKQNPASLFLMNEAAGTGFNPLSAAMTMGMKQAGAWKLMAHGYAFLNFIQQSGPRGDDAVFSTNHLMIMAEKSASDRSSFMLRGMLSLEPATITDGYYPLLFQTGETANGHAIIDGQHPHDLFMELSAQYAIQLNQDVLLHFYAGVRGDPALGPVAYPHRVTAEEIPQATLSHHLQDSTHIADDVLTAGLRYKIVRFEFSGFHGAEPDEHRWDFDQGAIDSWSTRVTFTPNERWVAQASTGRLKKPEQLEPGDVQRTTASATYDLPTSTGFWASTFIWGWNHKFFDGLNVYAFVYETLLQFQDKNYATLRTEFVDKEELFTEDSPLAGQVFRINSFTFGYARDIDLIPKFQTGIGANFTLYSTPSALDPYYGKNPKGFLVYLRIRKGSHSHH